MKKIIIIGATSGIGRGLAEVYSQEDYLIGITGRRENLLEEVCARDKDKLFYQVCDITDTQATISSLETLTQKMGGMDILIICAGTVISPYIREIPYDCTSFGRVSGSF